VHLGLVFCMLSHHCTALNVVPDTDARQSLCPCLGNSSVDEGLTSHTGYHRL